MRSRIRTARVGGYSKRAGPSSRTRSTAPRRAGAPRSNAQWLADLRCARCPSQEAAVAELSSFLWAGLAQTFGTKSNVSEQDLDDFTQDAMLRILTSVNTFRGDSRFTTWALTIAIRVGHSALRRQRSANVPLDRVDEWMLVRNETSAASDAVDGREGGGALLDALRTAIFERLTEKQRTVVLAELRGIPPEEMADFMGSNRNAIYKVRFDARRKLRAALDELGFRKSDVRELISRGE